ncbi:MAG: chemotaxis protein CheB [Saprospiraceae bacterium]|nr:chemotaxis protein CheB [Saprospiraceae bacterium]
MAENKLNLLRVVVVGGSAGSLETVLALVTALPARMKDAIILVLHRKNDSESILGNLMSNKTALPVREVEDKDEIRPGVIYIAPPDYHLLIENEYTFSLDSSEKVHFSRPSIDVTFESVAEVFRERAIGVLLSGANADGASGLLKIKAAGGLTIVQDPLSAEVGYMPQQAVDLGAAVWVLNESALVSNLKELLSA